MKKFILSAGLMLAAAVTFAGAPKGETKDANASEAKEASVSTTQAMLYWFDANTGEYLGHKDSSGCDESTSDICAEGYSQVTDPSNPQQPSSSPDQTARGVRP